MMVIVTFTGAAGLVASFALMQAGVDSMALASLLDKTENIMVRAGAHCAHPWFNKNGIPSSLRVSFHLYNTVEEAELFAKTLRLLLRTFY